MTGPAEARRHFERGMLALHSFWYEEARDELRAATASAPEFAMGYWGEALTSYHPAASVAAAKKKQPLVIGVMGIDEVLVNQDWSHMEALIASLNVVEKSVLHSKTKPPRSRAAVVTSRAKLRKLGSKHARSW